MRLMNMTARRRKQLDRVEKLINAGWSRGDIAKQLGYADSSRVVQLIYELRREGKLPYETPDRVAAQAEFLRVHVLLGVESRRRM